MLKHAGSSDKLPKFNNDVLDDAVARITVDPSKDKELWEAQVCLDHVHMLIEIPPKFSVLSVVGYIKGKSSILMYEKIPALQRKYKKRDFWCRGYDAHTVGKNTAKTKAYISNQLKEDRESEQLSMLGKL